VSTYQKQSRHTHIHGVCFLSSYIVTLLSNPFTPILCGNKYTFIYYFILFKKGNPHLGSFFDSYCAGHDKLWLLVAGVPHLGVPGKK
jgi:hypothetical protein